MALDFPSNPIDGQIYNNYVWSAGTSAWKARPQAPSVTTQSPLAPASPNVGDIWINTNLGISFHYYDDGTSKQWVEMVSSAVPAVNTIMPAGTIVQTARATAPDLWLLCDGSAISRTTYATLFNAIGTSYGSGNGSTTFNIPNLQGKVPVGKDAATFSALGGTGGAEAVTLTAAQSGSPAHQHANTLTNATVASSGHTHYEGDLKAAIGAVNGNPGWLGYPATSVSPRGPSSVTSYTVYGNNYSSSSLGFNHYTPVYGTTAGPSGTSTVTLSNVDSTATNATQSHTNLQPYLVLNYMIKV